MAKSIPFGAHSTADQVLAGVDLWGKRYVVTGCNSGIGLATMNALSANGAQVIGLARSMEDARAACRNAGPHALPVACDLGDLDSVAAAAAAIHALPGPLDAIVANAGIANPPALRLGYGIERQFLVNHIGHFSLVNLLADRVREGTGRIVIVSGSAGVHHAPAEGIMFDNLDGRRFYKPLTFYGQSKFANALFAKELSRRLAVRGIMVNSLHPGVTRGTRLHRDASLGFRITLSAAQVFMRSPAQGAATQALLAASPRASGITGEYWVNCRIAAGNPLLQDAELAGRLWSASQEIIARRGAETAAGGGMKLPEAA